MQEPNPISLDDIPGGPPAGTLMAHISDLPDHGGKDITFSDGSLGVRVILQRTDQEVNAFINSCPHAQLPLNLFDDNFWDSSGIYLICRTHGALFHPETGRCVRGPCKGKYLRKVAIKIIDGSVYSA